MPRLLKITPEQRAQELYAFWLRQLGVIFCASAGGLHTSKSQAVKMKRAGYQKGCPDITIYEPRHHYHGFTVEVKVFARATPEQLEWQKVLNDRGYCAAVMKPTRSIEETVQFLKRTTEQYLRGESMRWLCGH